MQIAQITFPVLPDDLLMEAVPGNIRKAEHFVAFLKRFVEYLKVGAGHISDVWAGAESTLDQDAGPPRYRRNATIVPTAFEGYHLHRATPTEVKLVAPVSTHWSQNCSLRFCAERLQSLVRTLELNRLDEIHALQKVASFATLVATYEKG